MIRFGLVWFMVVNVTFNNISVISWRSVLLIEETGVSRENHRPVPSHWQISSHNVISGTPPHERDVMLRYMKYVKLCPKTSNHTNVIFIPFLLFYIINNYYFIHIMGVMAMVFNATLSNISLIPWRSVLLMEETGVPGENHRPVASHWQTLSHNVVSSTPRN
jgi:hypothetical protein